jgi:TRAP-type C4-dicarboxylate transport system permease small subunit
MLQNLSRRIDRAVELAVAALFMAIVVIGGLQVFCRFALNLPLNWSEELQIFGHVWIVFLTIPIAYHRGSHILMSVILERLPLRAQAAIGFAVDLMWLWLGASAVIFTLRLVRVAAFQRSPALEIPMSYVYWGMVAGSLYLGWIALRKIWARIRGERDVAPAPVEAPL